MNQADSVPMPPPKYEVGQRFTFQTTDTAYYDLVGRRCTIFYVLTEKDDELDYEDVGPMYRVRFDEQAGDIRTKTATVFEDELIPL